MPPSPENCKPKQLAIHTIEPDGFSSILIDDSIFSNLTGAERAFFWIHEAFIRYRILVELDPPTTTAYIRKKVRLIAESEKFEDFFWKIFPKGKPLRKVHLGTQVIIRETINVENALFGRKAKSASDGRFYFGGHGEHPRSEVDRSGPFRFYCSMKLTEIPVSPANANLLEGTELSVTRKSFGWGIASPEVDYRLRKPRSQALDFDLGNNRKLGTPILRQLGGNYEPPTFHITFWLKPLRVPRGPVEGQSPPIPEWITCNLFANAGWHWVDGVFVGAFPVDPSIEQFEFVFGTLIQLDPQEKAKD